MYWSLQILPQILLRESDVAIGIFLLQIFNYSVFSLWPKLFLLLDKASLEFFIFIPPERWKRWSYYYLCFKERQETTALGTENTHTYIHTHTTYIPSNWYVVSVGAEKGLSRVNTFVMKVKVLTLTGKKTT